jgi:hypothetical protein
MQSQRRRERFGIVAGKPGRTAMAGRQGDPATGQGRAGLARRDAEALTAARNSTGCDCVSSKSPLAWSR